MQLPATAAAGGDAALAHLVASTSDGFLAIQGDRIAEINPRAEELLGWTAVDARGLLLTEVVAPLDPDPWVLFVSGLDVAPNGRAIADLIAHKRGGDDVPVTVVAWPIDGVEGGVHLLLQPATGTDENQLQRAREQLAAEAAELWRRAFHDPLTNLANRNLFRDRAEHALGQTRVTPVGLLSIDIDGFKAINDALGHGVGDALLVAVAGRLRESVGPGDTVGRPGGDEFIVLVEGLADADAIVAVADHLLERLTSPFGVHGRTLVITASIGIAMAGPDTVDVEMLIENADLALYRAKAAGRNRRVMFERSMQAAALARLDLEHDLRAALENGALEVHYQPVGDLREGRVKSVEALVRWTHPERGPISPVDFIPIAEETGIIIELGEWVLTEACRQARRWQDERPDEPPVSMAVNLSGRQLQLPGLAREVAKVLRATGWKAENLVLEITESVLMEETGTSLLNLGALRKLGVRLSLDDFGTGYSSLARLRSLPVDELKIDKSFVHSIEAHGESPLVSAIIAMGHSLGLDVVGEGVETARQLEYLRDHGCDRVQGYLLSRPAAADLMEDMVGQPAPMLRLTAARAAMGDGWDDVDVEIMEVVAAAISHIGNLEALTRPLLESLAKVTGLESTYLTRINWARAEQEILFVCNTGPVEVPEGMRVEWSDRSSVYSDSGVASSLGLETYVAVPVVSQGGGLFGTLCAAGAGDARVNRTQLGLMELYGRLIADEFDTAAQLHEARPRKAGVTGHTVDP